MSEAVLRIGGPIFPSTPWFHCGTHHPHWLWTPEAHFPMFVSNHALARYKNFRHRATSPWALDSGGFMELKMHGRWVTTTEQYFDQVCRYDIEIGMLDWASPQDWMCEPWIVEQTGLSVREHQERTVQNYLDLTALWDKYCYEELSSESPFIPVLQGWEPDDYFACIDLYAQAGVDLEDCGLVGLGSVCRRQGTGQIGYLIESLAPRLALHGFGVKTQGLLAYGHLLESADSLAWSYDARRSAPLPGHDHKACQNCWEYARGWVEQLAGQLAEATEQGYQDSLFAPTGEAA